MSDKRRSLRFTTPPDDLNAVHDFLADVLEAAPDIDALDRMAFETALVELAGNVIQHADGGGGTTCVLTVSVEDGHLRAELTDSAESGGVRLVGRTMPDALDESGRGIPFIQALVDTLEYRREGEHNVWTIARGYSTPAGS
jgi:serine/threonine-protein kinase RsbW